MRTEYLTTDGTCWKHSEIETYQWFWTIDIGADQREVTTGFIGSI